jgi:ribulose-phosphate 3-epimerase
MRSLGLSVGLAANPQTPFFLLEDWLDKIDLLLLMTVHPGFAGQHFIQEVIEKVGVARSFIDSNNLHCDLQVDGGIDIQTAPGAVQAGARVLVAGTAVFSYGDESKNKTQDAAKAVIDLKNAAIGALTGQLNS